MKDIDLLKEMALESTRSLPRAAHDGTGWTSSTSFAALVGKPGETVDPADYVLTWAGIAGYLRVDRVTVWRQARCGSLSWIPTVNGVPTAHVSSLNSYYADLVDGRRDQRVGNLRQFRTDPTPGS